jgi:hypothetical protein
VEYAALFLVMVGCRSLLTQSWDWDYVPKVQNPPTFASRACHSFERYCATVGFFPART